MLLNYVEARARQARGARWEGEASGDGLDGAALGGDWTKAGRGVGIVPRGGRVKSLTSCGRRRVCGRRRTGASNARKRIGGQHPFSSDLVARGRRPHLMTTDRPGLKTCRRTCEPTRTCERIRQTAIGNDMWGTTAMHTLLLGHLKAPARQWPSSWLPRVSCFLLTQ